MIMLAGMSPREKPLLGTKKEPLLQHQKETLGSDGETSDYQRSTPSPRDGDSGIQELLREGNNYNPCPSNTDEKPSFIFQIVTLSTER